MAVPKPAGEEARLAELLTYDILDTVGEQAYDDIANLAARICDAPIALISFVDGQRQWFKSRVGLEVEETPRDMAFCAHALLQPSEVLIVPDATLDDRFADNPLVVGDPCIRFYAGAPLVTPAGDALGTMCVIDRRPRILSPAQVEALRSLSRLTMTQLALRRSLKTSMRLTVQQQETLKALAAATEARTAAQAQQHATERRTRLIVDTALDAVVMIDQNQRVTFWNAQAEELFGWPRNAAIGRPLTELAFPAQISTMDVANTLSRLAVGEGQALHQRVETTARERGGREFPVELTIRPIREDGATTFSAFIRDISTRRRSEQLLETQYRVSRTLSTAANAWEAAGPVIGTTCEALGWDVGALWMPAGSSADLTCLELWLMPGLDGAAFVDRTLSTTFQPGVGLPGRVLEGGQPVWIPDIAADADFPRREAALAAGFRTAVVLPAMVGGGVGGVIEFFSRQKIPLDREVMHTLFSVATQFGQFLERKQAEEAVRRSEARTRAVVDNMLEGLMVVGADLRIIEANDALARIFRYDRQELPGLRVVELMPDTPDYQDPLNLTSKYRQSLGRVTEHEGRRRDGEIFPLELQVYEVITPEGQLIAAHVRDLSQEREAERLKQQFVASVSHELRTPLTAIRGALGLLQAQAGGALSDDALEIVNVAERNAVRLVGIINDLLDFERLRMGLLTFSCDVFALDQAVERAVESVSALAREAAITVTATSAGLTAYGDEDRVIQVLVNLLTNAVKFSPHGSRVSVTMQRQGETVLVSIQDEGRGVPADLHDAIFEPFRQLEGSDARRHRGSGLGLAICRDLVHQQGGTIGVECPPSGGSIFWFTLPLRPRPALL